MNTTELFTQYAVYYNGQLNNHKEVLSYLHNRGLAPLTIKRFGLGYCDGTFNTKLIDTELATENHLYSLQPYFYEKFKSYILIPIFENKKLVYFTARYPGQSERNHLHLNGCIPCPYNIDTINTCDTLYITESPIDAMIMEQNGYSCVSLYTSSKIKSIFMKYFKNVRGRIVLLFDNDINMAGQKGALSCADDLKEQLNMNSYIATLPFIGNNKKTDINMVYLYDRNKFKSIIDRATDEAISYETTEFYRREEEKRRLKQSKAELSREMSGKLQLIKSIPITDIMGRFIKIEKTGFGGQALCPFHPDSKTKSLLLYNNSNMGFCMSGACEFRGDAVEFVRKYFNLGFKDAVQKILEG